jgi:predicted Fe-S protein YdhL (DUF1289 family)
MKIHEYSNNLGFFCPGCKRVHQFNRTWQFNENYEKPTVSPSLLVRGTIPITEEQAARIVAGEKIEPVPYICHSFITDGKIQFLSDSTHDKAGQALELEDFND